MYLHLFDADSQAIAGQGINSRTPSRGAEGSKSDYVRPLRRKSGMIIGARLDTTSRSRTANLVREFQGQLCQSYESLQNLDKVSSTKHKSGRNLKMKVGDRRVLKRLVPRKRKTAQPQCPKYNDNCHQKTRRIEDFKRTLKQKSSGPNVKKQEFRFTEKNRRYEAPGKFEYNRKDKKFPASTNYNKHYEAPVTKYESVQRYQDSAQKGYYNKNYEKHSNHDASKHAQTNYSKSQKFKEPPKETCTLIVKEGLRTKEIFLER
ncbi:hypothetical protein TNCV_1389751 [Trichonephila clavipes]|nr:hypothetical protein TNCV_1389751 [Trichonephila clavipes]